MAKIPEERQSQFLKELSALSRKHKITVGGCGCCGSPWLHHDSKLRGGKYEIDEMSDKLVFISKS